MRVPVSWLRAHCDPELSTEQIADALSLSGTEVERIERVGVADTEGFVVGKVVSAEQHPDADRLRVCVVDDGEGERTIVCGAPNVEAGQTVAVALPGAVMPDGTKLGKAKLRGVESSGMILAEDEVGVGEDHGGIMVLPDDAPAGAPLVEHLQVADDVLELEVNPNRPDCLAVYGVARELHAVSGAPLAEDPAARDAEPVGDDSAADHASVEIADPEICLRFTARVFEDVKVGPSPLWLKARLTAAGQRPISNVVDITNYVMLETGQPLHAFDLDEVRGSRIVVRRAEPGERMTTLDGVEREFDPEMALVCDAEGPSGIAGVMGGQVSEVSAGTTRVLMEAATWVGPNILKTSAALGLRSEASARFEKQLHPDLAIRAQQLAARLMLECCGARLVPGTLDEYPRPVEPQRAELRRARATRLLGMDVPADEVGAILERLGFGVEESDGSYAVTVPAHRAADVSREADLIEEVARVHGLDKLPTTLPARRGAVGRRTREQAVRGRLEDALRDRGLHEIVAYSFTSPDLPGRLRLPADQPLLEVANPLSGEQSVMRPLLLPGLLDAARHNAAHGRPDAGFFESAHVYEGPAGSWQVAEGESPRGERPAVEPHHIGAVITQAGAATWRSEPGPADFYAAKALAEAVLGAAGVRWWTEPGERPFLHPGRAAGVYVGTAGEGREAGWIGELHPLVARAWELDGRVAAFELDADHLAAVAPGPAHHGVVSSYPAVLQDIAVVLAEETPAAAVRAAVRDGAGELLESAEVFDVYRGDQVGAGRKSLALRLAFRARDRTLTEAEVAAVRDAIERELDRIGGQLRG